ncbi:MAG: hypothetical protein J6U37_01210 [Lachnospiraceae bacterium]|nr:hypothetical protein [Lachnospiraceae bacterium]
MKINCTEKVKGKVFIASFGDFESRSEDSIREWQIAYFELLSWKNTWDIPYEMDINSTYDHIPYVRIVIPVKNPDTPDALKEMMERLGYRNIEIADVNIELVEPDYDEKVDEYYIKW